MAILTKKEEYIHKKSDKCLVCGESIPDDKKTPTCSFGTCRSKYYRRLKITNHLNYFVDTGDDTKIRHLKISDIQDNGFKIIVIPELEMNLEQIET